MSRDLTPFEITKIRSPRTQGGLSSTMLVRLDDKQDGYITIGFSLALVRLVGRILPRGVSVHDPAFLSLHLDPARGCYIVYAQYIADKPTRYVLWEMEEKPAWLRGVKKVAIKGAEYGNENSTVSKACPGTRITGTTGTAAQARHGSGTGR